MANSKDNTTKIIFLIIVIVIIGLIATAVMISENPDQNNNEQNSDSSRNPQQPIRTNINTEGNPFMGVEDAPVVLVEFSDFECDFCAHFHLATFPKIKEKYIDTGKVKYVVKDFPLVIHNYAEQSAIAAECTFDQGGNDVYFEYIDILYNNQDFLNKPKLKEYAQSLNLNMTQFNNCLENKTSFSRVQSDGLEGEKVGVTGTPHFFVNGVRIDGAYPFEVFDSVIQQELAITNKN